MSEELPEDWFEQFKAAYPRRGGAQGWPGAERKLKKHLSRGVRFEAVIEGARKYAAWCEATGKVGTELVKMAETFCGPGKWWAEDYPIPKPQTYAQRLADDMKSMGMLNGSSD